LRAAILTSNRHDTQPWLFKVTEDAITLFADRGRNLGTFDPFRREMHLGLGAALENLVLAARASGLAAKQVRLSRAQRASAPRPS
jgi:nitroreductase